MAGRLEEELDESCRGFTDKFSWDSRERI